MRRRVAALFGLVCAAGLVMPAVGHLAAPDRVYTVPEVLHGLARDPRAWVGRTALVSGTAIKLVQTCGPRAWCPTILATSNTLPPASVLLLEPGPANPLVLGLRHLPLVGLIMPAPQRLLWHLPAIYRLQFQAVPGTACHAQPCINALLVDAAPQAQ